MNRNRAWYTTTSLVLAAGLAGCAHRELVNAASDTVHLKMAANDYRKVSTVNGKSCTGVYLGFLRLSTPDVLDAERAAMAAAPSANLLVNKHVYVQYETVVPLFFSRNCYYVEGFAVALAQ